MTLTSNDINQKQNEPDSVGLLMASDAAYMYARVADGFRTAISIVCVAIALFAFVCPRLAAYAPIAGMVGTVLAELLQWCVTSRCVRKAVLFQEWFDTDLFGLEWNATLGPKPREEDRRCWEKRFHGPLEGKRNWYIDVRGLPFGHAVLLCQRENLSWDARLRRMWGTLLVALTVVGVVIGVVIGWVSDWKVSDLVIRWLVPIAPALITGGRSGYLHGRVARKKDELINRVEDLLGAVSVRAQQRQKRLLKSARQFQDAIARLRQEVPRVPNWLFCHLHGEYEDEAKFAAKKWRDALLGEVAGDPEDECNGGALAGASSNNSS